MLKINSEQDFLSLIEDYFPAENGHVTLGRGDDCSILHTKDELCISKDLFLEGVHFRREYFSPADIAYKALAVNISDISAMGGIPKGFALGLIIPPGLKNDFWTPFFQSMSELANKNELMLAGGDLSRGSSLGISITIWGETVPGGKFLSRGNAQDGDILFLQGKVGLARAGLLLLEEHGTIISKKYPVSTKAHLRPQVRVKHGNALASNPHVLGLMDLSDGLAQDLPRFIKNCEKAAGAEITLNETMLHEEVLKYASKNNISPVEHAFRGGEDYALLGAVSAEELKDLMETVNGITPIGKLTEQAEISLNNKKYSAKGFDHFSRK